MNQQLDNVILNIKYRMMKKGYTQAVLADKLGLRRTTVSAMLKRPKSIKVNRLVEIARILECDVEDFFVDLDATLGSKQGE